MEEQDHPHDGSLCSDGGFTASTSDNGDESVCSNPSVSVVSSPLQPWIGYETPAIFSDFSDSRRREAPQYSESAAEAEMIKERFAKLLLGEDLSGGGKGVSTALAVSNAITNLSASIFGELWQLEPLPKERKLLWRKEMDRLLSVSDYIVEFVPSTKCLADGSKLKVMDTKPRLDLRICLPALQKLDAMLIEVLDSFTNKREFWYVDRSTGRRAATDGGGGGGAPEVGDRWWLPTPELPPEGLSPEAAKHLQQQRESVNQILKAALAVNAQVLSEMRVPEAFIDSLPRNGRSSLGDVLHRTISSDKFSAADFISGMNPEDEHGITDVMNRVEAALHVWRRKLEAAAAEKPHGGSGQQINDVFRRFPMATASSGSRGVDGNGRRRLLLAERAESLLLLLRIKFPGLPQSVLDVCKIQYCKDVGQSILESYSRVLESLAYNIRSRIDEVLWAAAKLTTQSTSTEDIVACGLASPVGRQKKNKKISMNMMTMMMMQQNQNQSNKQGHCNARRAKMDDESTMKRTQQQREEEAA